MPQTSQTEIQNGSADLRHETPVTRCSDPSDQQAEKQRFPLSRGQAAEPITVSRAVTVSVCGVLLYISIHICF